MHWLKWSILLSLGVGVICLPGKEGEEAALHISNGGNTQQLRLLLGVITPEALTVEQEHFCANIKRCLNFSGQFGLTLKRVKKLPDAKHIQKLYAKGYDCIVFMEYPSATKKEQTCTWWLEGEKKQTYSMELGQEDSLSYQLATSVLFELTGQQQPFLSKIAYRKKQNNICSLCVADFDGLHGQNLYTSSRIVAAPVWNNDTSHPALAFSQFTPSNVRIVGCDLQGNQRVLLDLDGTSVGLSYAPTGKSVAYCRSGKIWLYTYDTKRKRAVHSLVINELGVCGSPVMLANGDIIYCTRGKIKYYEAATKKRRVLTQNGYCVGSAYTPATQRVVYSRRVNGYMQLFVYDMLRDTHEQVTFASKRKGDIDHCSHKIDPCWSPCGQYCAFGWEQGKESRIGIIHVGTKEYHLVTPLGVECSYPAWSPFYEVLPSIRPRG